MLRRIELALGLAVALAAVAAIIMTIFRPVATTGLTVGGQPTITRSVYARDAGLVPMLGVIALIALLGACVTVGAYLHARHGSRLGRALVWWATPAYVLISLWSFRQGSFGEYPAMLSLLCALVALLPAANVQ
jgi:hypothetical protein